MILALTACQLPGPASEVPVVSRMAILDRLIDVRGISMHIHCVGDGAPTVIVEAGHGLSGSDWHQIQPELGQITRACVYDRAGTGYSGAAPEGHTSHQVVAELHELLAQTSIAAPYVFLGHSVGGLYARLYARQYPRDVVGMVLVDATPAEATPIEQPRDDADFEVNFQARLAELRAARASLGDIPLVVLTRGKPNEIPGLSAELGVRLEREWREMQAELVHLSANSDQAIAEEGGHFLHWDTPELVVAAVRTVVTAARTSGRVDVTRAGAPP